MTISRDEKLMASCLNQGMPVVLAVSKSRISSDYGKAAGLVEQGFVTVRGSKERGRKMSRKNKRK